jgi:hypothetical protein
VKQQENWKAKMRTVKQTVGEQKSVQTASPRLKEKKEKETQTI